LGLRKLLDRVASRFEEGAPLHRLHALYEMVDTILYTPGTTTRTASHVRDGINLKRMMTAVIIALVPCMWMACYNTGLQAALAIEGGASPLPGWRESLFAAMGLAHDASSVGACFVFGLLHFLPALAVTALMGGTIEPLFAIVRRHEINEGFLVTLFLFPLTLPPTIPLWQVALGAAFGIVFGKEIFGGTGMNFLNPALTGRAFLFFAYPAEISGNVWVAASPGPDGLTGATWLAHAAASAEGLAPYSWWDAFVGQIPGSMGETSALACLLGAVFLLVSQVASWRTMLGVLVGTLCLSLLLNAVGSAVNPMFALPFHWHLVLGGWAFGTVFMATDPVSGAFTGPGQLAYGFGIGALTVLVRVVNPAYPEGMMLAILFMNMFAPLLDHFVVRANVERRLARQTAEVGP